MTNQKQLIILLIIVCSLTSFLAGYLLIQPTKNGDAIIQQQRGALIDRFSGSDNNITPTPLPEGLFQTSTDSVLAPTNTSDDNSVVYYHQDTGFVSKADLESRTTTLVSKTNLGRLADVVWSPDKNRVVTLSGNSLNPIYKFFDYSSRINGTLGTNIKSVVFSRDSRRLATIISGGGDSAIQVSEFGTKNFQTILKTRLNNVRLFWPNDNFLAFSANDNNAPTQSLFKLSENGDLDQLIGGATNLSVNWSPDGTKLLYSEQDNSGPILYMLDVNLNQSKILPISTKASNCAWSASQQYVVCAAEIGGETTIKKLTLANNVTETLFSNLIISPDKVFLSRSESFLVITSSGDQSLWEIKLK